MEHIRRTIKHIVRFWFARSRSGNFNPANEPCKQPELKVNNEELQPIVKADPFQTTEKLAVCFDVTHNSPQ